MSDDTIYMFNALWFKPEGGRELYKRYLKEAGRVIEELKIGAKTHTVLAPQEMLIGEWDPDVFFVVEYPSRQAFDRLVNSPEYRAVQPLRDDAIEKSLLIQSGLFGGGR